MKQNIYDNNNFFKNYTGMRNTKKGKNANDLIEIPTIRKMLPNLEQKTVLELGCGSGENSQYFKEKGATYVLATDISNNMINLAKEKNNFDNVEYKVLAMEDLNNIEQKFDVIISSLAIHYIENFDKLCQDVSEHLNSNGYFIFSQEHPIETGTILNKECNNKNYLDIGSKNYYLVSDYNNNGKRIVNWCDTKVVKYHRNFSTIINTIIKYFEIDEITEPIPTKEVLTTNPEYQNQFDRPFFLFIKVHKK